MSATRSVIAPCSPESLPKTRRAAKQRLELVVQDAAMSAGLQLQAAEATAHRKMPLLGVEGLVRGLLFYFNTPDRFNNVQIRSLQLALFYLNGRGCGGNDGEESVIEWKAMLRYVGNLHRRI